MAGCSYIARHNVELGVSLSHACDMHGGCDRNYGTDIAGTTIEIYNNTFRMPQPPIVIRGVPEGKNAIHHNWFVNAENEIRDVHRAASVAEDEALKKGMEAKSHESPRKTASFTWNCGFEFLPQRTIAADQNVFQKASLQAPAPARISGRAMPKE